MPSTPRALDLCPRSIGIWYLLHRPLDVIVKRRPPAPSIEFGLGAVEGIVTLATHIHPGFIKIVVFPAKRPLRRLVLDHVFLLWGEWI